MTIEVVEYSPEWKTYFERLKAEIWPAVADLAVSIEHVGSTSVEGLKAKPVIDIDIIIRSEDVLDQVIQSLQSIGYDYRGDLGIEGREAFRMKTPRIQHNLYVCREGCTALRNHLILRDHLRDNPQDRKAYGEMKQKLAEQCEGNIDEYIEGKTEFILSILQKYDLSDGQLEGIRDVNKNPSPLNQ